MTHYSENPGMVRVDYFKPGGKWYMTEALNMDAHWDHAPIHEAIEQAMVEQGIWRPHFTAVILHPYHRNAHPIMFPAAAVME